MFTPLTPQQVFDAALFGIRAQKYMRSVSSVTDSCVYRGDHGRKCGIGHPIPDEVYNPVFDTPDGGFSSNINSLLEREGEIYEPLRVLFKGVPSELLTLVQRAHDRHLDDAGSAAGAAVWEYHMANLAMMFQLVYTPVPDGAALPA